MSIITYNNDSGIDFSSVSLSEASYMINSYIEESLTDIQIKYLLTDKRSLQEYGTLYFTEDNSVANGQLKDKIKQIAKNVWNAILGLFHKIKQFFSGVVTGFKISKAKDEYKKMVEEISNDSFEYIVEQKVTAIYDLDKFKSIIDYGNSKTDTSYAKKSVSDIKQECLAVPVSKIFTKKYVLDYGFGGFKDLNKEVQASFSKIQSAFRKTTDNFDNNVQDFKAALKFLTNLSSAFSEMIIHNAKMTMVVAKSINADYVKNPDNGKEIDKKANDAANQRKIRDAEIHKKVEDDVAEMKKNAREKINSDIEAAGDVLKGIKKGADPELRKTILDIEKIMGGPIDAEIDLKDTKDKVAKNISDRHQAAAEEINKSLRNIHRNLDDLDDDTNSKNDMDKMLDDSSRKTKISKDQDDISKMLDDLVKDDTKPKNNMDKKIDFVRKNKRFKKGKKN